MNYNEFLKQFKDLRIFSINDIRLIEPEFNDLNLTLWNKKGYIIKIRNGWYTFADVNLKGLDYYLIANRIYNPSYISLELAFNHYGIIPEAVLTFTSVTTNKTMTFKTPFGEFKYHTVQPVLNWGYKLIEYESQQIKMAEIEKAILDFLYLNPKKNNLKDFSGMRFDIDAINSIINIDKLQRYQKVFASDSLFTRLHIFLEYLKNA